MQNLASVTNPRALSPAEKLRLLDLEEMELQLEQERRRREQEKLILGKESVTAIGIQEKHKAFIAAYPFANFVSEAFQVLEPGQAFMVNWHIFIICELLQATILGEVRNFIINQPRRTMKSLLSCVFFPAWVWTFLPHLRFLYTSYTKDFAKRDNRATNELINNEYYQRRFGHVYHLTSQRAEKLKNNRNGFRVIFTIGRGVGEGGDFVIADDPNDVEDVESEVILEKTNRGWDEISSQNVRDRRTAVRGIIQQRTAPGDVTGHILDKPELKALYTAILCLPMRYEMDHPDTNTPDRPLRLGKVTEYEKSVNPSLVIGEEKLWVDPRDPGAPDFENVWYQEWYDKYFRRAGQTSRGEGQLLWENYIPEKEVAESEAMMGAYGTSAQNQQRPIRRGGNFFNSKLFPEVPLSSIDFTDMKLCRYWDKAGTENGGDWTVGTLIGRTPKKPYQVYIIDIKRKQIGYYERMELMKATAAEDMEFYVKGNGNAEYTIAIEREPASSGKDLATIERDELIGYDVVIDLVRKKKYIRAKPVRSFSESGRIAVVQAPWNPVFFRELEKYDPARESQKNDQIDTMSGGFRVIVFGSNIAGGYGQGGY